MKIIFFLLSFIPFISIELNAQQDYSGQTDSLKKEKDSTVLFSLPIKEYSNWPPELPYRICLPPPFPISNWSDTALWDSRSFNAPSNEFTRYFAQHIKPAPLKSESRHLKKRTKADLKKRIISPCKSTAELISPLSMQLSNTGKTDSQSLNPETETSVWWYVLPTSGFALLVSLYFIKKKKD